MTFGTRMRPATGAMSLDEIEIELVVERRVDRVCRGDHEKGVSVRGRAHHGLSAHVAAGAGPVLDDEWLAEPLRQPLPDQARDDVGRGAAPKPTINRTGRDG